MNYLKYLLRKLTTLFKRASTYQKLSEFLHGENVRLLGRALRAEQRLHASESSTDRASQRADRQFKLNRELNDENNRLKNDNAVLEALMVHRDKSIKNLSDALDKSQREQKIADSEGRVYRMERGMLKARLDGYERETTLRSYDENTARAALMQLRVMQMNTGGRTGYGVTAFIPEEVIKTLNVADSDRIAAFSKLVFDVLLQRALAGMFHINSRGNISAILFAPLGSTRNGLAPCGAVFDVDQNPRIEMARSTATDPTVRAIEQSIINSQPENKKSNDKADALTLAVHSIAPALHCLIPRSPDALGFLAKD